ncbi:hypothetical protein [Aridibaculum aurantiacum]|uniref:hypothetical protein n=1 Tax=Aridibaculum aurantiacum TaxID=2810307 RepID=UPI001A97452C|nr:hypothetical protein [Aridibaculum aurantiacum]
MPPPVPQVQEILVRLQLLEEKIKFAAGQMNAALLDGKPDHEIRRLKQRLTNLQKEKCLYYEPMQKLKPLAGYRSYLYNKIEGMERFTNSRYTS